MRMMGRVVWESLLRRCGIVNHDCHDVEMMRMISPHPTSFRRKPALQRAERPSRSAGLVNHDCHDVEMMRMIPPHPTSFRRKPALQRAERPSRSAGLVNHDCHDVEMMRMIPAPRHRMPSHEHINGMSHHGSHSCRGVSRNAPTILNDMATSTQRLSDNAPIIRIISTSWQSWFAFL